MGKRGMMTKRRPRTCVACKTEKPKNELIRVVRSPEGHVYVDPTGKGQGRGAYVCRDQNCIELAKKKDILSKALKTKVPAEIYEELSQKLGESGNAGQ